MASNESNLEIRAASTPAELEQRQRRRMLAALAVLLTALIVVIIRDRQFWFPPSPEPVAVDRPPSATSPVVAPSPVTAPPVETQPRATTHSRNRHSRGKPSPSPVQNRPDIAAVAAPPMVATTNRAVLPPLDIEVVAGNQRHALATRNNSVKVDMQSGAPEGASPAVSAPTQEVPEATAQVSMSPHTAERVSRTVSPNYPLLAKQMKVQGAVVLQALIDKAGKIEDLHVVSGPAILSAAAQEAVKQWHFKPYYQGGQPVETEARITVNFTISTY
jgi:periplasmic protein TonB